MREYTEYFQQTQNSICEALEKADGKAKFKRDKWERTDMSGGHGGGGLTAVISEGAVFEKGGVNFSSVNGTLPKELVNSMLGAENDTPFKATGISLVLHPNSPLVPTIHANFRYLEVAEKKWFGGGIDLTPYYFFEDDAKYFHGALKKVCDRHNAEYYPRFKKWCDEYFYLPHRGETRGIGGLFFDYLGRDDDTVLPAVWSFIKDTAVSFAEIYLPLVERRKSATWSDEQKQFQLIRRGRYVEFNLVYDRGTLFGLKTQGRSESILMSLPPLVRWEYDYAPKHGTPEAALIELLRHPREWV